MDCYTRRIVLLPALLWFAVAAPVVAASTEEFFAAARKGDAAALKEQLDKGIDVNAKWRYEQTALMIAASRGHVDAVMLLLDRGADVSVKDSFYGVTPLAAAMGFGSPVDEAKSAAISRALIEKGAPDKDQSLTNAARAGKKEVVKAILPITPWKAETLNSALAAAAAGKHTAVEEMLKAAGAKPPPEVKVDAAVLARYAGSYAGADGMDLKIEFVDGKLRGGVGGQTLALRAMDQSTFEPEQFPGSQKLVFLAEGERISGLEVRVGPRTLKFTRTGNK